MSYMKIIIILLLVANVATAATYYISKSAGSNSNTSTQAQSKTTPWAHLPGMPLCTSNCASYTPQAGDVFILKGGDTWVAADLGINWPWSGSSGSRITITTDPTWYSGGSWARPIFDCEASECSSVQFGNVVWISGSYVTFDNVEMTGYKQSTGNGRLIGIYGNNNIVSNCYLHGWSRTAGSSAYNSFAISNNWSGGGAQNTIFRSNVIDGEDSPNQDFMGGILHGHEVDGNVIRYVYNGLNGRFTNVHGNLIEYNFVSPSGDHCNLVFVQDIFSGTTLLAYNNIIRHAGCSGGSTLWLVGASGQTTYAYNNIIYDVGQSFAPKCIVLGDHPIEGDQGTFYIYNNFCEAAASYAIGNGELSPRATANFNNNHFVNVGTVCDNRGVTCVDGGENLVQTTAEANASGYTSSQSPYVYAPSSGSSPTVGIGENLTASCSGSVVSLCSDILYPVYNTTNHTVETRIVVARPTSGLWDAGPYQYAASGVGGSRINGNLRISGRIN